PHIDVAAVFAWLVVAFATGGLTVGAGLRIVSRRSGQPTVARPPAVGPIEKMSWRMPPLTLLRPVKWSPGLRVGMLSLRLYLVLSAVLLLVKAVQLGGG